MKNIDPWVLGFGIWAIIAVIIMIVWIFVKPDDDLCNICGIGLAWPLEAVLLALFIPYKLLEILQKKILERRAKKKYYDEDEDWYDDEYGSAYIESNYKED